MSILFHKILTINNHSLLLPIIYYDSSKYINIPTIIIILMIPIIPIIPISFIIPITYIIISIIIIITVI